MFKNNFGGVAHATKISHHFLKQHNIYIYFLAIGYAHIFIIFNCFNKCLNSLLFKSEDSKFI